MKKRKFLFFTAILVALVCGCHKTPVSVQVSGIEVKPTSLSMTVGETSELTVKVSPVNATDQNVTWSSSNSAVAAVDASGKVTAVKEGSATITVTSEDGGKTATCAVSVSSKAVSVTGVSLNKSKLELTVGDAYTLLETITPSGATNTNVSWSSDNTSVATVSPEGQVTAVMAGTATVMVTTDDGDKTATCVITVLSNSVSVTGVSLDKTTLELTEGDAFTLVGTISPSNATNTNVSWSSDNTSVATVSPEGTVTAVMAGTANITVTTSDGGKSATCAVTVASKAVGVTGVSLNKTTQELIEGDTFTLVETIAPAGATNKNVSWSSDNTSVATVSAEGKVTAVKAGTANITVTTSDGGKTATCVVTVTSKTVGVTGVSLNKTNMELIEGDTFTLVETIAPAGATNKNVSWSSDNTSVATVSAEGKVTAVKAGTANITVTTADGGKKAVCAVTVTAKTVHVSGITFDQVSPTLTVGEKVTFTYSIVPFNATNTKVNWISSNPDVATVADGVVTAVAPGTATIIVSCEDGGKAATFEITINPVLVTGVTVTPDIISLVEGDSKSLSVTVAPEDATDKNVTWISSDDRIATVDASGNVTAVKAGTATITATSKDSARKKGSCVVTVSAKTVKVTGVSLNKTSLELTEGDSYTLVGSINPAEATNKNLTWSSDNTSVATVSAEGKVTALKGGTATITVTTEDGGKTAACAVSVITKTTPVSGVSLNKTSLELLEGDTFTLVETIAPSGATNKNVSWSSSNTGVAAVSPEGKVTAVKAGTATITVTTSDGGKKATCAVTVKAKIVRVISVSLNKTKLELDKGETFTLVEAINPSDATNKNVSWSSSNTGVATVSNGVVTAVAPGTANITVTTEDGGNKVSCVVTVRPVLVTGVTVTPVTLAMLTGDSESLSVAVAPEDATEKNVTWSSSDEKVATVDASGKVTAVKAGTVTITATSKDSARKTGSCVVTVSAKTVKVTGVSLNKTTLELIEGDASTLVETVSPADATNTNVRWSSDNTSVATVDASGKVTTLKPGTANITVTTEDGGKTATCAVTVSAKTISVTDVSLNKSSLELIEGDAYTLLETVTPSDATSKKVIWSSDNTDVATVSSEGKVTAVKAGTATITVTTEDGGKTATCAVTVAAKTISVTGVSLNKTTLELTEGDAYTLLESITPSDATNKNVSWYSDNTDVVTVSAEGKVTAVKVGTATITVTTSDGGKTSNCVVTVYPVLVTGVTVTPNGLSLEEGESKSLSVAVAPENATDKSVKWSSSDEKVATVDASGNVTAVKAGTVTITATSNDSAKKIGTCSVTVTAKIINVTDVTLDRSTLTLDEKNSIKLIATVNPAGATDKEVIWSSSDDSVVTVDNDGTVTAVKAGKAVITVTTKDGDKSATCEVTVNEPEGGHPGEGTDYHDSDIDDWITGGSGNM